MITPAESMMRAIIAETGWSCWRRHSGLLEAAAREYQTQLYPHAVDFGSKLGLTPFQSDPIVL